MKTTLCSVFILLFVTGGLFSQREIAVERVEDITIEDENSVHSESPCKDDYSRPGGPCYDIPVVVHVIHESGDAIGSHDNPSESAIRGLIAQLSADFRGNNEDVTEVIEEFCPLVGDAKMSFHLHGDIIREVDNNQIDWGNAGYFQELSPKPPGTENYLHMWMVDFNGSNTAALGMECPLNGSWQFGCMTDGVVVDVRSIPEATRTPTHEVGHWLGLRHVFASPPTYYDDGIDDTPCQSNSSYSCSDLYQPANTGSLCESDNDPPYANVQNFMQVSNLEGTICRRMFTHGQCNLMRSEIATYRHMLAVVNVQYCDYTVPGKYPGNATADARGTNNGDAQFLGQSVEHQGFNPGNNAGITAWPNPTNGILNLSATEEINKVVVLGWSGKVVLIENGTNPSSIDLTRIPAGVYNVVVHSKDGKSSVKKVVKL